MVMENWSVQLHTRQGRITACLWVEVLSNEWAIEHQETQTMKSNFNHLCFCYLEQLCLLCLWHNSTNESRIPFLGTTGPD